MDGRKRALGKALVSVMERFDTIVFAVLFGSNATNKQYAMSDVDVGIMFTHEPTLLELGRLNGRFEEAVDRRVDTVVLNRLYETHPKLAYNIVASHTPLLIRDQSAYGAFKHQTYMYYFDIKPTLCGLDRAFLKRWQDGTYRTS